MPGQQTHCALAGNERVHYLLGKTAVFTSLLYPKNNSKTWKPIGDIWYCCTNRECVKQYENRLLEETPRRVRIKKRKTALRNTKPTQEAEDVLVKRATEIDIAIAGKEFVEAWLRLYGAASGTI